MLHTMPPLCMMHIYGTPLPLIHTAVRIYIVQLFHAYTCLVHTVLLYPRYIQQYIHTLLQFLMYTWAPWLTRRTPYMIPGTFVVHSHIRTAVLTSSTSMLHTYHAHSSPLVNARCIVCMHAPSLINARWLVPSRCTRTYTQQSSHVHIIHTPLINARRMHACSSSDKWCLVPS